LATPNPNLKKLAQKAGLQPAFAIPPIPRVDLPARVTNAFPELQDWYNDWYGKLEDWRQQTNVAVKGTVPLEAV
jgi:hypothetical protein